MSAMMESKQVYKGKVISVKVDKVQINKKQTIREVVEHGGSAAILPLIGDTIIMEKQYRYPVGKDLFEIPAGTLEKGESPEKCAARELIEETGYRAGNLKQLGRFYMSPGYCTEVMHVFVATNLSKVESPGMDDDEVIEIVKVSVDDAVKMILKGEIEDAKTVCAVLAYAQQSKR
ncbi:MAG: ADP-ribose pyrophosphatase [Candidatus Nitrosomirales archaeon]|jgi:ADP-ribose pyrophosphatase